MHPTAPIRSFVRRNGRITQAQQRAVENLWPRYGLAAEGVLDLARIFARDAPCHLEIGFGMGHSLVEMARRHPENNYLGVDVYLPGIGSLLDSLDKAGLDNVRVLNVDAVEVLTQHLPEQALQCIYLFFPDPWPKKRHHKRRLVQADFARRVRRALAHGGMFHMATDWEEYALHMREVMEAAEGFYNPAGTGCFHPRPAQRPLTKFEQRGLRRGHAVYDLLYVKA